MGQQRDLRHAAAQAFKESLQQLQQTLESADQDSTIPPTRNRFPSAQPSACPPVAFDLASLEDAIADIEQFIQHREKG